ncbi:putative peptidylglycine alpha-hydroxylating monooxygenase 1 [Ditylenchus destructor]|nr:putative peptidylglycine alpha-hydroxylating monooxygenase 1 [Ditylenchus destructor]
MLAVVGIFCLQIAICFQSASADGLGRNFLFPSGIEPSEPYSDDIQYSNIQMPGVITHKNDTYLCTAYALNTEDTNFLVGFDPIAHMHGVHHVLLFGCDGPGSDELVWNCGEMTRHRGESEEEEARAPTCTEQPNILYAWAHDAPKLDLPEGVAFRVGGETKNKYLVLQVHYMHETKKEDFSGVRVASTPIPQPKTAATLLVVTGGEIAPKSTEAACVVDEQVAMHPFAFRVHTHRHGKSVGGWVVKENPTTGVDQWTLLGSRDPQLPQLFEDVKNKSIVAARCDIKNEENRKIQIGPTGEDEMCNFYLMYWVDGDDVLTNNVCFSPGSPQYHWSSQVDF